MCATTNLEGPSGNGDTGPSESPEADTEITMSAEEFEVMVTQRLEAAREAELQESMDVVRDFDPETDRNDEVKVVELQRALADLGFATETDGDWGSRTNARFQRALEYINQRDALILDVENAQDQDAATDQEVREIEEGITTAEQRISELRSDLEESQRLLDDAISVLEKPEASVDALRAVVENTRELLGAITHEAELALWEQQWIEEYIRNTEEEFQWLLNQEDIEQWERDEASALHDRMNRIYEAIVRLRDRADERLWETEEALEDALRRYEAVMESDSATRDQIEAEIENVQYEEDALRDDGDLLAHRETWVLERAAEVEQARLALEEQARELAEVREAIRNSEITQIPEAQVRIAEIQSELVELGLEWAARIGPFIVRQGALRIQESSLNALISNTDGLENNRDAIRSELIAAVSALENLRTR